MLAQLPGSRGPLSACLFTGWRTGIWTEPDLRGADPLVDDDLHLALWCCYQLHHGGFAGLPADLEWDPATIAFRRVLEAAFEGALRMEHDPASLPADPAMALRVIAAWSGPSLARHMGDEGTRSQLTEFAVHRSAYQLKEADGHTWMLPRLAGRPKAAVVRIQYDEYGCGRSEDAHATLFASAMTELGLDATYGRYIDRLPGATLATDNLLSLFGLHGRLRGALVGHLAHFEQCSPEPMAHYLRAALRLGLPHLARFYEVHVAADVEHGNLAVAEVVEPLVAQEPALAPDVCFGAAALNRVEARFARQLLRSWERGGSSLRPDPDATVVATPIESPLALAGT